MSAERPGRGRDTNRAQHRDVWREPNSVREAQPNESVTPRRDTVFVVESQSIQFGEIARDVANRARSLGLSAPVFKSPPRIVGMSRTVRLRADGQAIVAVAFRNRPKPAVIADLIEGVIVSNDLDAIKACRLRDDLWEPFIDTVKIAA